MNIELPPELADALIMQESGGDPNAVNKSTGAVGLGQIMQPALDDYNAYTHTEKPVVLDELFDPIKNRVVTEWYLYERIPAMLAAYRITPTIENVLAAYNWGAGNLKKHYRKGKEMPSETRDYIRKVTTNLSNMNKQKVRGQ